MIFGHSQVVGGHSIVRVIASYQEPLQTIQLFHQSFTLNKVAGIGQLHSTFNQWEAGRAVAVHVQKYLFVLSKILLSSPPDL